jgi:WD40 repeat protein
MTSADLIAIKLVKDIPLSGYLLSVARVPGTNEVFVGSSDGKLHHVDLTAVKPQPISWAGHLSYVSSLVLSGKYLISAGSDRKMVWWDAATRKPIYTLENAHQKWIRQLTLSPDGKLVASVGDDMVCRLWDVEAGKVVRELRGHPEKTRMHFRSKLFACAFAHDGRRLATADQEGRIIIWQAASGKQQACHEAPAFFESKDASAAIDNNHSFGGVRTLAFSPDDKHLAAGGIENKLAETIKGHALVQIFDWRTSQMTQEFKAGAVSQDGTIEHLHFHHQGKWLLGAVGAGNVAKLFFYGLEQKKVLKEVDAPMSIFGMTVNETSDVVNAVGCARGGRLDNPNGTAGKVEANGHIVQWSLKG